MKFLIPAALTLLLGACGGGGGGSAEAPPPPPPPAETRLELADHGITKLRASSGGELLALAERALPVVAPLPERRLLRLAADGSERQRYAPPAGWALLDFAAHPSGETSVVLASATRRLRLQRLDAGLRLLADREFGDAALAADPLLDEGGGFVPGAAQPYLMQDAARLAPLGEDLALALRSGLNAVVAYRLDRGSDAQPQLRWRQLVEPGSSAMGRHLLSGSHDVFGALQNHVRVQIDSDAQGRIAVAVSASGANRVLAAHAWHWGGSLEGEHGLVLTQLDAADGRRRVASPVLLGVLSELHGLRSDGAGGWLALGRQRTQRTDTGWDAYLLRVAADGSTRLRLLDVDRGDVLFDAQPLPDGRLLAAGASAYAQNPAGASVSEEMAPLLALLEADGSLRQRLSFAAGPRQNQLRSLLVDGNRWRVAGLVDAPGTHSGDADAALIRQAGFVRELRPG